MGLWLAELVPRAPAVILAKRPPGPCRPLCSLCMKRADRCSEIVPVATTTSSDISSSHSSSSHSRNGSDDGLASSTMELAALIDNFWPADDLDSQQLSGPQGLQQADQAGFLGHEGTGYQAKYSRLCVCCHTKAVTTSKLADFESPGGTPTSPQRHAAKDRWQNFGLPQQQWRCWWCHCRSCWPVCH